MESLGGIDGLMKEKAVWCKSGCGRTDNEEYIALSLTRDRTFKK